jgi:hypothetical protein
MGCEGMLWILLWQSVNDVGVRASIRRALGFCPRHTLRLCQIANAEGLGMTGPAIIFADVLTTIRMLLQTHHSRLLPEHLCLICVHEQEIAQAALHTVLQDVNRPSLGSLIREHGVCQPRYRVARTLPGYYEAGTISQLCAAGGGQKTSKWRSPSSLWSILGGRPKYSLDVLEAHPGAVAYQDLHV